MVPKEQNAGANDSTLPFSLTSQPTFPASGDRTIYLNVRGSTYNAGLWGNTNPHIDVQFTPKNPISNSARVTVSATTGRRHTLEGRPSRTPREGRLRTRKRFLHNVR